MIAEHEARKLLIEAGYEVDLMPYTRHMMIIGAKYQDVKNFLTKCGYEGDFWVCRKINAKLRQNETFDREGIEKYTKNPKTRNQESITENNNESETIYEQLEFQF